MSLTAQQPEVNLVRVAIEALAGVLGGTQSLHTDAFDEALALPTEHAARLALRTQQVIAEETGVVHVADPLGGSWYVEGLTDELERQAEEVFAHLGEAGSGSVLEGVFACIDDGWFVGEIADVAYAFQSKIAKGEWTMVGVNGYVEDDGVVPSTLSIGVDVEREQLDRLAAVKQARDDDAVRRSLARIARDASDPEVNLMPALIESSRYRLAWGRRCKRSSRSSGATSSATSPEGVGSSAGLPAHCPDRRDQHRCAATTWFLSARAFSSL